MPLANDLPHELYSIVGRSDSTQVLISVARQKDMNSKVDPCVKTEMIAI